MNIWMVAREYAGLAESGGVKNVVCSLSEELAALGHDVTFFMPYYGCTETGALSDFRKDIFSCGKVFLCGGFHKIEYSYGVLNGVKVILVGNEAFYEKNNVYTYGIKDKEKWPECKTGTGYSDNLYMNSLFLSAVMHYGIALSAVPSAVPDVIHCHDACTAALPAMIRTLSGNVYSKTAFAVTIHNAGPAYHHEYPDVDTAYSFTGIDRNILEKALNGGRVEPYLLASIYSEMTTVSPDYAKEILDPDNMNTDGLAQEFYRRKTAIRGITNGIDIQRYIPEDKNVSHLPFEYSPSAGKLAGKYACREHFIKTAAGEDGTPVDGLQKYGYLDGNGAVYISYHGRLVRQKGIFVLIDAIKILLEKYDFIRFIINGQGEEKLQQMCAQLAIQYPGRLVYFAGYDKSFCRLCTAAGDFAVLPSEFEPCGLEDFIAQIFGTVPVAHATGGLKKIINGKTGFTYAPNTPEVLASELERLSLEKKENTAAFDGIIRDAAAYVALEYSWKNVAKEKYEKLYKKMKKNVLKY